jgi:hypothetical protein
LPGGLSLGKFAEISLWNFDFGILIFVTFIVGETLHIIATV